MNTINDFDNKFKEIENLQEEVKNNRFDANKILEALEDYKFLLEFKPFKELVNTQPVSTETLYDACNAYARWYGYTQCKMGLQKILFFDGYRKDINECREFRVPWMNNRKMGLDDDEDAWAKASEDYYNKELEKYNN